MFIVDTHCDTLLERSLPHADNPFTPEGGPCVTPDRLRSGGVSLQVCALFAGSVGPTGEGRFAPRAMAEAQYAALPQLTEHEIRLVDSPFDVKEGENCVMLSIEGGEIIGDSLDDLRMFRKRGVRIFSLTWNHENLIAYPHCSGGHHPLKPFGWEVVRELNRLGIAADVAHLGEGGFWDLIRNNEKPPMTSHSCCRSLCNHTRNLTDDQIRALIERGGWMGINFYARFLSKDKEVTLETVCDHIDHVAKLGGLENVGFGSDFDGIDVAPVGLEHPGCFPALLDTLRLRGYDEREIEGIAGGNFLKYMKQFEEA